ncbi:hypothetical protein T4D_14670 [Trichinella pseudospiralis]|uniref:Uncharacterized protein n=1 Tax=Trichinella pseudospiralis TaxID=6337 RepID=A0A0V1FZ31_TRIPS|nr:hypothetical protein T4D_14670 [Trichinella pseudospiralis]
MSILCPQYSNLQWRLNKQAVATCTSSTGAVSWWWLVLARFGSILFVFNFQSTLLRVKVNFIACYASDKRSHFFLLRWRDVDALGRWLGVVDACSSIFIAACFFCSLMRKRCFSRRTDRIIFTCIIRFFHCDACCSMAVNHPALTRVERNSERECRHVHTFFGQKAVQCFCYHIHNGTDLTDQTSCFDRKLCALIGAVKPAIFAPLEPEGGLMIRSLLGKLLNLSSLLTTPTVVQNCRCCSLSFVIVVLCLIFQND